MSMPGGFAFDPAKLAKSFSARQPAESAVLSGGAAVPACCLQTSLRLRAAGAPGRTYWLELPLQTHRPNETPAHPPLNRRQHVMTADLPAPVLQVLAAGAGAELLLQAGGASECPPGRENAVRVTGGAGEPRQRTVPFESWVIPLVSPFELEEVQSAEALARIHPCRAPDLAPAVCAVSLPGCPGAALQATIAVFPDLRWSGELSFAAEPDDATQKGYRLLRTGDAKCTYGPDEWQPETEAQAKALCPWLEGVEMLARSLAAFAPLQPDARSQGLDNPRLSRRGALAWTWPQCRWRIESALAEQPGHGLLSHRLSYEVVAEPLLAAEGEMSLLGTWLESPLWWERLAPWRAGLRSTLRAEIAQELGLWLVAEGRISLRLRRREERPASASVVQASARGGVALELEGRTSRPYEGLLVRAGSAAQAQEPAGFTLAVEAAPVSPMPESAPEPVRARLAFSGLQLHSLEKVRPGLRVRRLRESPDSPLPPLSTVLQPRVWPAAATTEPVAVPWLLP